MRLLYVKPTTGAGQLGVLHSCMTSPGSSLFISKGVWEGRKKHVSEDSSIARLGCRAEAGAKD